MNTAEKLLLEPVGGSFRDPGGRLYTSRTKLLRIVEAEGASDLLAFLATKTNKKFTKKRALVGTRALDQSEIQEFATRVSLTNPLGVGSTIVEHERLPFRSFPYEWPFQMVVAAANLTLDLAESALEEGFGLKDATPYNVLFRGPDPVFVDILSFERRDPRDPIWLACGQFERSFLIPLLASSRLDMPLQMLLAYRRDGLYARDVYGFFGIWERLLPSVLASVTIPAWLKAQGEHRGVVLYQKRLSGSEDQARFIMTSLLRRLRRRLNRIPVRKGGASSWADYTLLQESYSDAQSAAKKSFFAEFLREVRPRRLLDVGCNAGEYSFIAARNGCSVTAIDADPRVVGEVWKSAAKEGLDVLPLVINLTQPSPAGGWRNSEWSSFLDRAQGSFDSVSMLAVIHHLLVTDRIPLEEVLALCSDLTISTAVVEFVSPEDAMFERIARTNRHLYQNLTRESFETACLRHFRIIRSAQLPSSSRWLYLLQKQ